MREHAQRRRATRRTGRRTLAIAVTTVVALGAAGGGVALAVGRTGTQTYRTAMAGLGTVEQTIDATGTVASAERADAAFTVAGTVASVGVAVGDTVAAGDVLASLDPTSLQDAIDEATATLADAEQQLEDDIDSQTASTGTTSSTTSSGTTGTSTTSTTGTAAAAAGTTSSSGSSSSTPTGSATAGTTTGGASGSGTSTQVTRAVQAVTAAQQALLARYASATEALAASDAALTASQTACTAFLAVLPTDLAGEQVTGDSTGSGTLTLWPATVVAGAAQKVTGAGFTAGDELDVVVADGSGTVQVATVQVAADGTFALARLVGSTEGAATVEVRDTSDATLAGVATTVVADSATSDVPSALAQCQSSLTDVADAQTLVGTAQTELLQLATALDDAVADLDEAVAAGSGSTTSGSTPSTGSGTGSGTSTGTSTGTSSGTASSGTAGASGTAAGSVTAPAASTGTSTTSSGGTTSSGLGGSSSGTSTVASAADLVADQAAITLAEADLALAESQLQFVDLTTPIAGTVAAVGIAAGDTVSASSTTAVITVIGATGYVVTATVPLSQVKIVEVGQSTDLEVPVTDESLAGTVSSIGVLNASTSSSTPSYTVTVAVDPTDVQLYDGSSAQVQVTVAGGEQVLTVPSSAVHLDGSSVTVQVLRDGVAQDVDVTRGAVGTELTEITEGLSEGDEVVLADLTQEMVSEESSTSTGLSGLSGSTEEESTSGRQMPDFSGGQMPSGGFGGMGAPPGS